MSKLLIILVPGGGVEPPRGCPRRILSPFLTILQGIASRRIIAQKCIEMSRYEILEARIESHGIAQKCGTNSHQNSHQISSQACL
jgi:hypothetical protein